TLKGPQCCLCTKTVLSPRTAKPSSSDAFQPAESGETRGDTAAFMASSRVRSWSGVATGLCMPGGCKFHSWACCQLARKLNGRRKSAVSAAQTLANTGGGKVAIGG